MNKPVAWIDSDELWNLKFKGSAVAYLSPTETKLTKFPLYTHPVKELHLSLQKSQEGELLAVTYTDDEHRIVEVLWEKPPVKELTVPDGLIDPKSYYIGYEDGKKKSQADIEYEADKAYWRNRTLTDEEILICLNHLEISESGKKHQIDFARAILRKAKEK